MGKNKVIIEGIILFCFIVVGISAIAPAVASRVLVSSVPVNYPRSIVTSPETLGKWMEETLVYQGEKGDYWKKPNETIKDGGGDCEDFAFLAKAILKDLGYEAKSIWIYSHKFEDVIRSHGICIYITKEGKFKYFSNQYLNSKTFNTLDELFLYEDENWEWLQQIDLPHKLYHKILRK